MPDGNKPPTLADIDRADVNLPVPKDLNYQLLYDELKVKFDAVTEDYSNSQIENATLSRVAKTHEILDKLIEPSAKAKRAKLLTLLCEGMSMRAISRTEDVSFNTVAKALVDAGTVCAQMHDELVQGVKASRIQCDEIWAFNYCKQRAVATAKAAPADAGDIWTWTGIDADSKLIVSYLVGDRSGQAAIELMDDLRGRLSNRTVQKETPRLGAGGLIQPQEGGWAVITGAFRTADRFRSIAFHKPLMGISKVSD